MSERNDTGDERAGGRLSAADAGPGAAAAGAAPATTGGLPAATADREDGLSLQRGPALAVALLYGRSRDMILGSVVLLIACGLLVLGLDVVGSHPGSSFSYGGAYAGLLSQLAITGPAAVLMGLACACNVFAGAIVLRLTRTEPFASLSDVVLAGFAGALVMDAALLFGLGGIGMFGLPEIALVHALVFAAYFGLRLRDPDFGLLAARIHVSLRRPPAWWPLVLAVWASPIIVQLASPAAPFMDVLPNHVAPVEHVRTFGSFAALTTSPSPIYGPSRLMLGYVATLGTLATMTGLHAVLAVAAFATPLTLLLAVSLRRLASALFGGSAGFWILLTFPLTFTFLRIPDTRGTVVAFPLALYALSCVAMELRVIAEWRDAPPLRPDLALTFAFAGAVLVHPLVGLFAFGAAAVTLALYPVQLGPRLVPALGGSAVMIAGQALTMQGANLPAWVGLLCLAAGVAVACVLAWGMALAVRRLGRRGIAEIVAEWSFDTADTAGICRILILAAGIGATLRIAQTHLNLASDYPEDQIEVFATLVAIALAGTMLGFLRPQRGWILLGSAVFVGCLAWALSTLIGHANLQEEAFHYEVPKGVEYWLPVMLALAGAAAISLLWRLRRLGLVRPLVVLGFLTVSVYPITSAPGVGFLALDTGVVERPLVDSLLIGQHRGSESLGQALRVAERGYWDFFGYPDSRQIIDAPRQEVVDEIRALEAAGRIGPSTHILHIANDFQQWSSVPIGVFTGAMETSVSAHPIENIHTDGGRLLGFDALDAQMAARPPFVVVEPADLDPNLLAAALQQIRAYGYREIWQNSQATIFEL